MKSLKDSLNEKLEYSRDIIGTRQLNMDEKTMGLINCCIQIALVHPSEFKELGFDFKDAQKLYDDIINKVKEFDKNMYH